MEIEREEVNQEANIVPIKELATRKPSPPLTSGHIPLSEMEMPPLDDEMVMDISSLTFDQVKTKIIQERWKYFPNDLVHLASIHIERVIVSDTRRNAKIVTTTNLAFARVVKVKTNFLMEEKK